MTTTITVKTHNWPVRVTINDAHDHRDDATGNYSCGRHPEVSVIAKDSEQSFYITNTRSISFAELPADWTPEGERNVGVIGNVSASASA